MIVSICLRLLLFLFVFSLEIRVKADEKQTADSLLQRPAGCLQNSSEISCAIQTGDDQSYELNFAKGKIVVDRKTTVIRLNDHEVRLVQGTLWIKPSSRQKLSVKTEFGEARGESEFWVERENERMVISATLNDVEMRPKGSSEILTVPSGLENFLGKVTREGRASVGLPTPISPVAHLSRWGRLYKGKKSEFEKEVAAFKVLWMQAKGEATEMQETLYQRKIASLEAEAETRAKSRQRVEARNRELREHFRRRVFGDE